MSRYLACTFMLALAAPLPARAADSAMLDLGQEAAPIIAAAANGALRLIYLAEPPAIPDAAPAAAGAPRAAGQPPDRPVIVLAGSCHWADREAGLGQTRRAFSASPVWLLEPGSDCDPAAIKAAFDAASAAPERERLGILLARGLRLSQVEPAPPAKAKPAPAQTGLFSGQLVISSLPAGASLGGGAPLLIEASAPDAIPAEPAPAEAVAGRPQPAVQANASGRAGLPEPAVVVGELASLLAADKRAATGAPREVRDRIREIDPTFFMTLLELGNFDPDDGQYVAAIQTELSGMNCYTGNVNGNWGPGSSSATGRYFSELGASQREQTPGLALYREIATHPRVNCPAPVVTVRTEPAPTATRERNTGTRGNTGGSRGNTASTRGQSGNVSIGENVSVGQGVRAGGQPVAPTGVRPANTAPRIDSSLLGVGSGVIK